MIGLTDTTAVLLLKPYSNNLKKWFSWKILSLLLSDFHYDLHLFIFHDVNCGRISRTKQAKMPKNLYMTEGVDFRHNIKSDLLIHQSSQSYTHANMSNGNVFFIC